MKFNSPSILGTGLVCLDIIKETDSVRYFNGGSCGNVTSALSFLGWNASVITGCYSDEAGKILNTNLISTGVKQIETGRYPSEAPRIIEELFSRDGICNEHKFVFTCSECGQKLPTVKLLNESCAKSLSNKTGNFNVLYSDRCSPGIHYLRKIFRERGDWTVYEPNSARNIGSFLDNALDSHIVKFSNERIPFNIAERLRDLADKSKLVLIVHTFGKNGLYFCFRKRNNRMSKWTHLDPQPVPRLIDVSGAGDWCTTGLLIGLVGNNRKYRHWLTRKEVISALQYGQALAAISCSFIGGQGLIYVDGNEKDVNKIFKHIKKSNVKKIKPASLPMETTKGLCQICLQRI